MVDKDGILAIAGQNENVNKIVKAINSLPSERKAYLNELFLHAPFFIFQVMELVEYKKGTVFIREKKPADCVYFLIDGRVQAIEHRVLGTSYNFTHYNAFESFGTMESLLDYDRFKTTLVTDTDCKFLVMNREDYQKWTEEDSHALKMISKETCEYLLTEARRDRLLRFLSGKDSLLMLMALTYEESHTGDGKCEFELTRQQLSEFSGLSLRTVNRAVQSLEEEGFWTHNRGKFAINEKQYQKIKEYMNGFVSDE
jgi:CRP/FNR family cyclic AMP-dependent transcriptional regulator